MVKSEDKRHILILDDIQLMCHFLFESLSVLPNVECHTATRISTAENVLDNFDISLAIIDLHLADGNGLTVVQKIRQGAFVTQHNIPILIFSGNAYKDAVRKCLAYDVNDFLAKPITPIDLKERVKKHFNREKHIKPADFYYQLSQTELSAPNLRKTKAGFVKEVKDGGSSYVYKPGSANKEGEGLSGSSGIAGFLTWPENATTEIHQLDRRLKDLCFEMNELYNQIIKRKKVPGSDEIIRKIRVKIDDIRFVSRNLKKNLKTEDFWAALEVRLELLSQHRLELLYKSQSKDFDPLELFKKLRASWMSLLNKPVITVKKTVIQDEAG